MNRCIVFMSQYWPSALTLGVVLYATLCSDPLGDNSLPLIPHLDKLIHAVMMGGLFGAVVFDRQRADKSHRVSRRFLWILAFCIAVFCVADELAQSAMNLGRTGDKADLIADFVGVAVAYFIAPPTVRKVLRVQ